MRFTVYQIAAKLEISRSSLQQYYEKGFIQPSLERAKGKGTRSYFSLEDIYRIRIFLRLSQLGFSLREAAEYSQALDLSILGKGGIDWIKITYENDRQKVSHAALGSIKAEIAKGKAEVFTIVNYSRIKEEVDRLFKA